jgi:hypothetical protein
MWGARGMARGVEGGEGGLVPTSERCPDRLRTHGERLGKDSCTGKLIKESVNAGQSILVLDRDGIQMPVVNA